MSAYAAAASAVVARTHSCHKPRRRVMRLAALRADSAGAGKALVSSADNFKGLLCAISIDGKSEGEGATTELRVGGPSRLMY